MEDLSSLENAARRLGHPDVTADELAQIAATYPALRPLVATHPRAYPQLRAWIEAQGTPPQPPATQAAQATDPTDVTSLATATTARRHVPIWVAWVAAGAAVIVAAASWLWPRPADSASTSTTQFPAAERAFNAPQDAIAFMVRRLAAQDSAGATAAFASTSMVDGYDFVAGTTRLAALTPSQWLPSSSTYYRALNLAYRDSEISASLRNLTLSIVNPQSDPTTTIPVTDTDGATQLAGELDTTAMSHLVVNRVDSLGAGKPDVADSWSRIATVYGADEYAEFAVLYDTANGPMSGGATLLRYDDGWHIDILASSILGVSNGIVTSTSEPDYEATLTPFATSSNIPSGTPSEAAAVNVPDDPSTWMLSFDGFGPVRIGMTADEAVATGGFERIPFCDVGALKWTGRSLGDYDVIANLNEAGEIWQISLSESPAPDIWGLDFGMTLDQASTLLGGELLHDPSVPDDLGTYAVNGPDTYLVFALQDGVVDVHQLDISLLGGNTTSSTIPTAFSCKAAWHQ